MNTEDEMDYAEYGSSRGRTVIYFHGNPGSPSECSIFDGDAKKHKLRIICLDRYSLGNTQNGAAYYQQLANAVKRIAGDGRVDLIGFSIGAQVALIVSQLLEGRVRQLHLVSAAAPLGAGDFIENMAGGSVFALAKKHTALFALLTFFQKLLARVSPRSLFTILFYNTSGKDTELSKRQAFQGYIIPILRNCFLKGGRGYMRDTYFYVNWKMQRFDNGARVYLWHGLEDNWAPFGMAVYLSKASSGDTQLQPLPGLSHYSCLFEAAPLICSQIATAESDLYKTC